MPTTVALVDDHKLFRKGMVELINGFPGFRVVAEANNGLEFTRSLSKETAPDILLLDINMPLMDGYETAEWLGQHYPAVKILALSMYDEEKAIIRMLRLGTRGYILKDTDPDELLEALQVLARRGFYHSELVSGTLLRNVQQEVQAKKGLEMQMNDRELHFLRLACSEFTYKEIADQMCVAPRTVDGYREALFQKLQVKSRTGLVLYAIKHGIVEVK